MIECGSAPQPGLVTVVTVTVTVAVAVYLCGGAMWYVALRQRPFRRAQTAEHDHRNVE